MDKEAKIEQLKKILTKASSLEKGKELSLAKEFISIDEKIDKVGEDLKNKLSDISEGLKKKLDEELSYEVDEEKIVESVLSKVVIPEPIKGDDGKDYILTEKDKKDIAKTIKVPVVEKVIEKTTETIVKEQPIITNEIKEVAVTDTPEETVAKINTLSITEENQIDASHIKNLPQIGGKGGSTARNTWQLNDVSKTRPTNGQTLIFDSSTGQYIPTIATDTDEKVKYNASDASAGYLADKVVAGTGITLSEGTGGDADKLQITNTLDLSGYVPYTGATTNVDLGTYTLTTPTIIGGTGTTSTLTLQSTSGVGTTGADIIFKVGNNGATEAMRIANSGDVTIGSGTSIFTMTPAMMSTYQAASTAIGWIGMGSTVGDFHIIAKTSNTQGLKIGRAGSSAFGAAANFIDLNSDRTKISGLSLTGTQAYSGLDLIQTWNTTGTPTGFKVNITDTASNAASLLMDLQVGSTSKFSVGKSGTASLNTTASSGQLHIRGAGATKATTALYVDNSTPAQILKLNNDGGLAVGLSTTLTGANSIVMGQYSQATGGNSVAIGYAQRATATGALCISANAGSGYSEASGPWSTLVGGELNKATGRYSTLIGGRYGYTTMYNQITFGHDRLVADTGSFQTSIIPLSASITGTAQTELFIPSLASGQAILPVQSWETNPTYTVWNVTVILNAFTASVGNGTGVQNECFGGEYRCIVRRAFGSTTVTMVGSGVQTIYEDADTSMATSIVTIDTDNATGALRVRFTPPTTAGSTTNTRVACSINYLQTSRT